MTTDFDKANAIEENLRHGAVVMVPLSQLGIHLTHNLDDGEKKERYGAMQMAVDYNEAYLARDTALQSFTQFTWEKFKEVFNIESKDEVEYVHPIEGHNVVLGKDSWTTFLLYLTTSGVPVSQARGQHVTLPVYLNFEVEGDEDEDGDAGAAAGGDDAGEAGEGGQDADEEDEEGVI